MIDSLIQDLAAPLDSTDPCGPDLDLAGDLDFQNFVARTEGLLPTQFFSPDDGKPFDRNNIDVAAETAIARDLLARTRDVRILVLLAKLSILDRDLAKFATYVQVIAALVEAHWAEVNPRGEDGDFGLRIAAMQSLDDTAPVILPLQHVPLARHPRHGTVSFRQQLLATGKLAPREGEATLDAGTIERIVMEADLAELIQVRDDLQALNAALEQIHTTSVEHLGHEEAFRLERLPALISQMRAFLDGFVARRNPAAIGAQPTHGEMSDSSADLLAPAAGSGQVRSVAQAAAALRAAAEYFSTAEPSSPALLLVLQAEQLIGRSFLDAVRLLVPAFVEHAAVGIGRAETFDIPLERLGELPTVEPTIPQVEDIPRIEVATRLEALDLLKQCAAFYTSAEPASAIPYLLERATALATRDFLSILKDMLPENTLKTRGAPQDEKRGD